MAEPAIELSASCNELEALGRALKSEADGKALRKELAANMRKALIPAAEAAKNSIMTMGVSGSANAAPALRPAIAKKIKPEVKLDGKWSGARVKARKLTNVRNFYNAPKRTQQATWRTQTFGNGAWRTQTGKFKWFDNSMIDRKQEYTEAVLEAMNDMAKRLASRV